MLAAYFAAFTQFNNLQIALADAHTVQFALKHVSKTKRVDGFVCHWHVQCTCTHCRSVQEIKVCLLLLLLLLIFVLPVYFSGYHSKLCHVAPLRSPKRTSGIAGARLFTGQMPCLSPKPNHWRDTTGWNRIRCMLYQCFMAVHHTQTKCSCKRDVDTQQWNKACNDMYT